MVKRKIFSVLFALVLALGVTLPMATPVMAATYYVAPGDSIQAAVDSASWGDTIILNDGTFNDYATVTVGTSGITIKAANPGQAILHGGDGPAFRLADGLSDVAFEGLVIQNRTGWRGGGIEAWDRTTSNINVRNNQFLNNTYNGILVGSEGGYIHTNWTVRSNVVTGNGFAGIELTNVQDSEIRGNTVAGGTVGILVQARNTVADSGMVTVSGVRVMGNTVSGAVWTGVYILAMASGPTEPFDPIGGAWATLEGVMFQGNSVDQSDAGWGAWVYGYLEGYIDNARVIRNTFTSDDGPGVGIFGNATNTKVVNNTFIDCAPEVADYGEDTKLPPYGPPGE